MEKVRELEKSVSTTLNSYLNIMDSSESASPPQNNKIRDIFGKKFNKNNNIRFSNVTIFLPADIFELKITTVLHSTYKNLQKMQ